MNKFKIQVHAGRYLFDKQTKKVKVSRDKGLLIVQRNQEYQTHFRWINKQTNQQQINLIVFPNDAKFESVLNKNNTYILRFQTDDDRYFFWFQEKIDFEKTIKQINQLINYQGQQQQMQVQEPIPQKQVKPQKMDIQQIPKTPSKPISNNSVDSFIQQMQKNLEEAKKHRGKSITHLSDILTHEAVNIILKESSQEDLKELINFLPQQQQKQEYLGSNLRSPQFLQAVDALTDALNSENVIHLFVQLGLNQQYLKKNYGVEAFVRALANWGQKKKEQAEQKKQ